MNNVPTKHLGQGDQRAWQRFQRFLAELEADHSASRIETTQRPQIAATLTLAASVDEIDRTLTTGLPTAGEGI